MATNRRAFLKAGLASWAALRTRPALAAIEPAEPVQDRIDIVKDPGYLRIACEEAWTTAELVAAQRDLINGPNRPDDPGIIMMAGGFGAFQADLQDIGEGRIKKMDALGIHKQVLMLTAPGVQILDADTGTGLARTLNDQLAQACRKYPARFAGLTVIAPQDPKSAVKELDRGMTRLGLKGAIVNSHIRGEYLDERKYWDILEAAEALKAPIYIHPTAPPAKMIEPYRYRALEGALAGFSHEVWLHTMGLITSGAFDRFPKLKLVIGHMGEGMPLLMYRFDYMQNLAERRGARDIPEGTRLKRKISDYMRDNLYITTSGMAWGEPIVFCQKVLGVDHVLYAMDYPYQQQAYEVAATDSVPIPLESKKKLFQTNAESVFSL